MKIILNSITFASLVKKIVKQKACTSPHLRLSNNTKSKAHGPTI
jgi:hypothetical protein